MLDCRYSNQAQDFLKKANKDLARRLMTKIEQLLANPYPQGVRTIEGYKEKIFRVRIGDFRILYEVDSKNNLLGVVKIDKRARVY